MRSPLAWMSLLVACSTSPSAPPALSGEVPAPSVAMPGPPLGPKLLAALGADDPMVRGEAAYVLGLFGDARQVDAIGVLVDDEDSGVRGRAIGALDWLAVNHAEARPAATRYLLHALQDGVTSVRK